LKEINDGKNPTAKSIHFEFQFKLTNNPIKSAKKVRDYLGINKRLQQGFKNSEEAFKYYRNIIELNGVFVFQYPLSEARGFSLMDKEFPVIVLNSGDTFNGKLFSLFHEFCHILFNTGGVFRDVNTEQLKRHPDTIEIFCNQFASEVLLPGDELLSETTILENKGKEWSDAALESIANIYKVSKEVILRKLLDLGKTTKAFYINARNRWIKKYKDEQEMKIKQEGGPTYHVTNLSHLGKNFVTQVLNNYHTGKLSDTQVADFLNIKINRIKDYEEKIA
jgi:Zn-dependent peptidase ImmA (M78 family)